MWLLVGSAGAWIKMLNKVLPKDMVTYPFVFSAILLKWPTVTKFISNSLDSILVCITCRSYLHIWPRGVGKKKLTKHRFLLTATCKSTDDDIPELSSKLPSCLCWLSLGTVTYFVPDMWTQCPCLEYINCHRLQHYCVHCQPAWAKAESWCYPFAEAPLMGSLHSAWAPIQPWTLCSWSVI